MRPLVTIADAARAKNARVPQLRFHVINDTRSYRQVVVGSSHMRNVLTSYSHSAVESVHLRRRYQCEMIVWLVYSVPMCMYFLFPSWEISIYRAILASTSRGISCNINANEIATAILATSYNTLSCFPLLWGNIKIFFFVLINVDVNDDRL